MENDLVLVALDADQIAKSKEEMGRVSGSLTHL